MDNATNGYAASCDLYTIETSGKLFVLQAFMERIHIRKGVGIDRSTWSTLHKKSFCLFSKRYFHSDL